MDRKSLAFDKRIADLEAELAEARTQTGYSPEHVGRLAGDLALARRRIADLEAALTPADADPVARDYVAEGVEERWGERCDTYDADCHTCCAWAQYDRMRASTPAWRKIDTAPQTGERVLLWSAAWGASCTGWRSFWDQPAFEYQPTHWQPLPPAPARETK